MPTFSQWEVWQAVWEHEDGTSKERPVLVLSPVENENPANGLWVVKFTKTDTPQIPRVRFDKSDPSFSETGLKDTCYLYYTQARKISSDKFRYRRGRLPAFSAAILGVLIKQALKIRI
jgi:mRNA-degrading endonuclease toxin of MazEF toxin-antitoxin module